MTALMELSTPSSAILKMKSTPGLIVGIVSSKVSVQTSLVHTKTNEV
jgi:hypothetical protein